MNDAETILNGLSEAVKRYNSTLSYGHKQQVKYWQDQADRHFKGDIIYSPKIGFKSLLQQLNDGELWEQSKS